ncbi:hypothetical protein EC991_003331 [Linnemannia zychae]|nr:hypothetical protein EC991_003331 [Linnemannia zychae]
MEGILKTFPQDKGSPKRQEEEYWQKLRKVDNDRGSREAILQHLQPYIQTEQLRQQQQQVQQIQQQYRLQQQLLYQQQKRLAEELEWLRQHQQKQAAVIERQQQQQRMQMVGEKESVIQADAVWSQKQHMERDIQAALAAERQQQDAWNFFTMSEDYQEKTVDRHQQQPQTDIRPKPQQHRQVEIEQQQGRVQVGLDERQRIERDQLQQLYMLRKKQEQQVVEQRQRQEQIILKNMHLQPFDHPLPHERPCQIDEVHSELRGSGPLCEQQPNSAQQLEQTFVSYPPQPWNYTLTSSTDNQAGVDAEEEDKVSEEEFRSGYYNQQVQNIQYDWRGLRRINKAFVPMPRLKRGRKGRGDLFQDDYHAGFNKTEILALSTAGKATYEAQRQKRQQYEEPIVDLE